MSSRSPTRSSAPFAFSAWAAGASGSRTRARTGRPEANLLDHPDAHEAISWARAGIAHAAMDRGLATSLMRSIEDETSELHAACQAVLTAGERLLERAQAAGAVRPATAATATATATASDFYLDAGQCSHS
ncbi:SbtR family transcriptional regulator [Nonomuraea sp. NPDC003707]